MEVYQNTETHAAHVQRDIFLDFYFWSKKYLKLPQEHRQHNLIEEFLHAVKNFYVFLL